MIFDCLFMVGMTCDIVFCFFDYMFWNVAAVSVLIESEHLAVHTRQLSLATAWPWPLRSNERCEYMHGCNTHTKPYPTTPLTNRKTAKNLASRYTRNRQIRRTVYISSSQACATLRVVWKEPTTLAPRVSYGVSHILPKPVRLGCSEHVD